MSRLPNAGDMRPESVIKKLVKAMLTELGAWQYWPVSNGMGKHGIPDCIFCYEGLFGAIETKRPNKKGTLGRSPGGVSPLQQGNISGIKAAGGLAVVVYDERDIDEVRRALLYSADALDQERVEMSLLWSRVCNHGL